MKFHVFANHIDVVSKHANEFAFLFTVIMTGLTWAIGGWDTVMAVLAICIGMDILTGMLRGFFIERRFSSRRLRKGFGTKVGYFAVILLSNMLDIVFFQDTPILRTATIWFYIYVEGSSVIENLGNLGVPIPQFFVDRMEQINRKVGVTAKMKNGKFVPSDNVKDDM